jgi:hypothetical protein
MAVGTLRSPKDLLIGKPDLAGRSKDAGNTTYGRQFERIQEEFPPRRRIELSEDAASHC